jgi:hypothetical protein
LLPGQWLNLLVGELADQDHDEVDQHPYADAAEGDDLEDAGPDLPDVETVHAQRAEEEAE